MKPTQDKKTPGQRLKGCREKLIPKMTQRQCASQAGFSYQIWNNIEHDRINIRKHVEKCAAIVKTSISYLLTGREEFQVTIRNGDKESIVKYDKNHPIIQQAAPIITWFEAGLMIKSEDDVTDFDTRQKVQRYERSHIRSFVLIMDGDSMCHPSNVYTFLPGDKLHFDPVSKTREPQIGDYVIARVKDSRTAIFRQLISDCGIKYLAAKNPQYKHIKLTDDVNIFGLLIFVGRDFQS